jgi:hypothetical protein
MCGSSGKSRLISSRIAKGSQSAQKLPWEFRFETSRQRSLFLWRRPSADGLEHKPPDPVVFGAWMGEQVSGDARQPVGSKGIQPRLLNRVEQTRGVRILWLMLLMDRGVVKAPLQHNAIRKRPQTTVSGGVRLSEQRVGVVYVTQCASARRDRARVTMVWHYGSRSRPIERW